MLNGLREHTGILQKAFLLGIVFILIGSPQVWADSQLDQTKLDAAQLPPDWEMTSEYDVPPGQIQGFETKFAAPISAMLNQIFLVDNRQELRINYLACPNENATGLVYRSLIELVGSQNSIVRKGRVVIEIIAADKTLHHQALALLRLSPLQIRKLKAKDVPLGWRLVQEYFLSNKEVQRFQQQQGVEVKEIINQFFLAQDNRVRINYIACPNEAMARITAKKLGTLVGNTNRISRAGTIVAEIISAKSALQQEAARLFEKNQ